MSIYDDAGVIQIPSAYKKSISNGTLYSVVPSNGDGDFTFTRGSSATRVNKDGLIEEVSSHIARLDYPLIDGEVQDCPALLLEPSRTNTFQRSEEFDNAYWSKSRIETPSKEGVVDPSGGLDAYTLEMSAGQTAGGGVFRTGISISGDNSISVFAKKKNANYLVLADTGTTTYAVYFDLENGYVGTEYSATGEIQDFGNGWYRCIMKYNATNSNAKFIYLSDIDGQTSNGVTGGDSIYIWGAQFELSSSYATSYIPTTSATVTRSADVCNGSGTSAEFNDSEGVLFAEVNTFVNDDTNRQISVSNGTTSNSIKLTFVDEDSLIFERKTSSGDTQNTIDFVSGIFTKIAFKYKSNDYQAFLNGFEVSLTQSVNLPTNLSTLNFDNGVGSADFYGKAKQLMTFKTALTDSELETLTSWDSFNAMAKGQLYTIE